MLARVCTHYLVDDANGGMRGKRVTEGITLYLTRAATHLPALKRALPFSLAAVAVSTFSSSDISYVALGCTSGRPCGERNASQQPLLRTKRLQLRNQPWSLLPAEACTKESRRQPPHAYRQLLPEHTRVQPACTCPRFCMREGMRKGHATSGCTHHFVPRFDELRRMKWKYQYVRA